MATGGLTLRRGPAYAEMPGRPWMAGESVWPDELRLTGGDPPIELIACRQTRGRAALAQQVTSYRPLREAGWT